MDHDGVAVNLADGAAHRRSYGQLVRAVPERHEGPPERFTVDGPGDLDQPERTEQF